jgi:ZIP family zinc transporter
VDAAHPAAIAILLLSLLSVVTTAGGVLLALFIRENIPAIAAGIGFSTGIMILVSGAELIPEAHALVGTPGTALGACLGASLLGLANFAIPHGHLVTEHGMGDTRLIRSANMVVVGLILHDVPEGFAMANAYVASPSLGLLVAIAIALHNLPEELAMAIPALAMRRKRFLIGAAVASALAEPLGAAAGLFAVNVSPSLNGYFMAFAAGAMLFVSFHELAPMARRYGRLAWFGSGLALSVIVHQALALVLAIASGS